MKKLTLLVPAYREGKSLASNLEPIIEAINVTKIPFEIILIVDRVNDDDTQEVAERIATDHPEVHLIVREDRQGVGTAIITGLSIASGDIVMPIMGDASESVKDIVSVSSKAQDGYDIVVGNRFMKKNISDYPPLKYCANRLCNLLVRLLFRIPTSDITNAFKAYSSNSLKDLNLKSSGYSIFLELPIKAYLNSTRHLIEIPVSHVATRKTHGLRIFRDGIGYGLSLANLFLCHQKGNSTY